MSDHSPGPWMVCDAGQGCTCGLIWSEPADCIVAHVVKEDDDHAKSEDTYRANERLIASAPAIAARLAQAERLLGEAVLNVFCEEAASIADDPNASYCGGECFQCAVRAFLKPPK